ncbi:MAG: hypothetical protein A2521_01480 [Deltaproteobacteria bacterium RIFOXYD12_FULL_57_12]|nr:MAG: hypothetical protein A2521_01480 [Deltaproteobacteria bacterium RIFOXYD12_FULL_57_12]
MRYSTACLLGLVFFVLFVGVSGATEVGSVVDAATAATLSAPSPADADALASEDERWLAGKEGDFGRPVTVPGEGDGIADPLEPLNRVFFQFNDKLYFWLLKPVTTVYSHALPDDVRLCIRNFFDNLSAPVRIVNTLLQGKVRGSGIELARFVINSTVGCAGFGDPAGVEFGLQPVDEDLGQTLGVYGIGNGIYLYWPIVGASSLRDTVGLVGDSFLEPMSYMMSQNTGDSLVVYGGRRVNALSFRLGDYEVFKETAMDPYSAMRDIYYQYRQGRIRDLAGTAPDNGEMALDDDGDSARRQMAASPAAPVR